MSRRAHPAGMTSRGGASAEFHPDVASSHRSSLFGSSFGQPSSSRQAGGATSSMQQALEEDNNRLTDDLSSKVTALRYASQSIHDEVTEQNRLLAGMVRCLPLLRCRFAVLRCPGWAVKRLGSSPLGVYTFSQQNTAACLLPSLSLFPPPPETGPRL